MVKPIKLLLADNNSYRRAGIRALINTHDSVSLLAEATYHDEIQRLCQEQEIDVLLLDSNLPDVSPVQMVQSLADACINTKILLLADVVCDAHCLEGLIEAGVAGCLLKEDIAPLLLSAIHTIFRGGTCFSQSIIEALVTPDGPMAAVAAALTEQEAAILGLLAGGLTNKQIALRLEIQETTVEFHMSNLFKKLGVTSRTAAAVWAVRHHLI